MKKELLKKAFITSLPVMAGYVVLGTGFGMVLKAGGYSIIWAFAMSLFIYAGSMQYVAVGLLTGDASFITTALTTLLVNSRHLFYGISMIDKYKKAGIKKPYLIFGLTDETYSLVCQGHESMAENEFHIFSFWVTLFNQSYWITGSVLGAFLGTVLKINTAGIDFSLTALFVTIVVDQWQKTKHHFPALTGLAASLVCLLIFGADNFLIPTMAVIAAVLLAVRKKEEAYHE